MNALQLCAALSSFALFAVIAYRAMLTPLPCPTPGCIARWAFTGACYLSIALGVLWWWMDTFRNPVAGEWHLCLVRLGVAGVFGMQVARSSASRERTEDRRQRSAPWPG